MYTHKKVRFLPGILNRFRKENDGVAAIEGAVVLSLLAGAFVSMADISVHAYAQNGLSNALRASVQYIANEGKDLGAAEQLFLDSYGKQGAAFSSVLQCSCPKKRSEYTVDTTGGQTTEPQIYTPTNITSAKVQDGNGDWAQCETDCSGGIVVKYLVLNGSATIRKMTSNETVKVTSSYSVRVQ